MITFILLVLLIGILIPFFFNATKKTTNLSEYLMKVKFPIVAFVVGIILIMLQPFIIKKVDPATIGLKVALTGSDRGVGDYKKVTGWVVINQITHDFVEIPKNLQSVTYESEKTFAKGGFPIIISPSFNYKVNPSTAGDMYVELRKPIKEIEAGWLYLTLINSINETLNRYTVDYIFNNREIVEKEIETRAKAKSKRWFTIDQFKANLAPPPALQEAVAKEAQAVKEAQAMKQVAFKEIELGKANIAKAKADSAVIVIGAAAESEKIKLMQKSLTKEYLTLQEIQNWDGKYPTHVLGTTSYLISK